MRVPVFYTDKGTYLHRRDPRVKLVLFAVLVVFLYTAPTWWWMLGATLVGLAMAISARVPGLVLWLLQLPNFLGLVLVPAAQGYLAGDGTPFDGLDFGLRLGFAWSAALFVSISLFSTIDVDHLTDGLRGLRVLEQGCFLVGYAFLPMYASLSDIFRTVDAMRLKGIELRVKRPLQAVFNMARLVIPAIITMARRAGIMMSVLQLRGFSFSERRQTTTLRPLVAADVVLLAAGLTVGVVAATARFGLLPLVT